MNHFLKKLSFACLLVLMVSILLISKEPFLQHPVQAQTVVSPISRQQVLYNALRYSVYGFTPSQSNIGCRTWDAWIRCLGESRTTTICTHGDYQAGHTYHGIPYKWGGGDSLDDLGGPAGGNDRFLDRLDNGDLVGDTYDNWFDCPGGGQEKPVCPQAAGVDCSGFVTRVWGRPIDEKYGTWTLPSISTPIPFNTDADLVRKMRMGDIFNYAGHHVVLLYYFDPYDNNRPYYYEARWEDPYIHRVLLNNGWDKISPRRNDNSGYRPYRYDNIVDDAILPDIKANYNDRNSVITIRNNSSENAVVQVTFYDSNGNALATRTKTDLSGQGIWMLDASTVVNNFSGSAVVAADKDISVVVQNHTSYTAAAYDGISPSTAPAPDPGFGRTGTTLRALPVYKHYEDWNTSLYIQNAGPAVANVWVYFYDDSGSLQDTDYYTVQPNASLELNQADDGELGSSFFGSAEISSNQPVAVVVRAVNTLDVWWERAYSAFDTNISVSNEDPLWVPLFYKGYYDIYSQIQVQNWGSGTDVSTWYYIQEECLKAYIEYRYINYRAIQTFIIPEAPLSSHGSVLVRTWTSRPLLGLVETDEADTHLRSAGYESISDQGATTLAYAPIVYKAFGIWATGIQVQNTSKIKNAKVKLYFLDSNGYTIETLVDWICPMGSQTFYLPDISGLPDNYVGSVRIESHDYPYGEAQNIVAVVNLVSYWLVLDELASYNCFNR